MMVKGRPGAHATDLTRSAAVEMVAAASAAAGALLVTCATLSWFGGGGPLALIPVSATTAAVFASFRARSAYLRYVRAAAGARSERRTASAIVVADPEVVVHGADVGAGGDADHVVAGPMLAVVETKTGTGCVRITDGRLAVRDRVLRGDPVGQVRRQARGLRDRTGSYVDAIVCIPGMTNDAFRVGDTWVCSESDLPDVLRSLPARVHSGGASQLLAAVNPRD